MVRRAFARRRRRAFLVLLCAALLGVGLAGSAAGFEIDKQRTFLGGLWTHGDGTRGVHEQITAAAIRRGMAAAPANLIAQIQAGAENVDVTHHFDAEYHFDSASVRSYASRFALGFQRLNSHLSGATPLADRNPEFFQPTFGSYRAIVSALPGALRQLADHPECRSCDRARLRRLALAIDPAEDASLSAALTANPNPDPHPPTNPESAFGSVSKLSCGLCGKLAGVRTEYLTMIMRVNRAVAFALGQSRLLDEGKQVRERIETLSDALRAYRAFQALGHAFHAAQDFFAHSNYVELMAGVEVEQPIAPNTTIPVPQRRADFSLAGLQRIMGADAYRKLESGAAPAIWLGEGDYCLGSLYNPDTRIEFRIPAKIATTLGLPRVLTTPRVGRNHLPPKGLNYCHYASVTAANGERTPGLNKDSPGSAEPSHINHSFARKAATDMTAVLWKSFLTTVRRPADKQAGTGATKKPPATGAACTENWWRGTWKRVEHGGEVTFGQSGGRITSGSYTWFGGGTFAGMTLQDNCRTMTGNQGATDQLKAAVFEIHLESKNHFAGNWRWATTPARHPDGSKRWNGSFGGTRTT